MGSTANCIAIFTAESKDRILANRGSAAWKLNRQRAKGIRYLVCTRNTRRLDLDASNEEEHRAAFLVGKIDNIVRSPDDPDRWIIKINQFAEPPAGKGWWVAGWQYPVAYTTFEALGLDESELEFKDLPIGQRDAPRAEPRKVSSFKEIIAEARRSLAKELDVPESSVIIEIRT